MTYHKFIECLGKKYELSSNQKNYINVRQKRRLGLDYKVHIKCYQILPV